MKINNKILSIPPYISTTWDQISSLEAQEHLLSIHLLDDRTIQVPNLDEETLQSIFESHVQFVEDMCDESQYVDSSRGLSASDLFSADPQAGGLPQLPEGALALPIRFGPNGFEGVGSMMQHNMTQKDMPDLPVEVLEKITKVAKALGIDQSATLSSPEPHCNCFHCQVTRAVTGASLDEETLDILGEEVSDEDLRFKEWDIEQTGSNLFQVSNPLDKEEYYTVHLGKPVGCTCGEGNCKHIEAVLRT